MNFILSMTGYAVAARETPFGSLNIELRSVNNRFLDVQFRLSEDFVSMNQLCGKWLPVNSNVEK